MLTLQMLVLPFAAILLAVPANAVSARSAQSPTTGTQRAGVASTNGSINNMTTRLAAPANLSSTLDLSTCLSHGGIPLICNASFSADDLVLIWSYGTTSSVTGFHIYRVNNGQHVLVDTTSAGSGGTLGVIPPAPNTGMLQTAAPCYAVAAYNSSGDGLLSAQYCPGPQSVYQTANIQPDTDKLGTWYSPSNGYKAGVLSVGYSAGNGSWGLLFFSKAFGLPNKVISAHLKMTVTSASVGSSTSNVGTNTSTSCLAVITESTNMWWTKPFWTFPAAIMGAAVNLGTGPSAPNPTDFSEQGPAVSFDVTPWMTDWGIAKNSRPSNNYFGFVLMGMDQLDGMINPNKPQHTDVCVSTYNPNSVVLQIQYQ